MLENSNNEQDISLQICVCSNANPLHYYVLEVPRHVDRWRECGLFLNHALLGQTTLRVG